MPKQAHAYFSGRVQGIGFRFTALDIAGELQVKGWVRNLADGGVEITAEAEEGVLKDFFSRIRKNFSRYIQDVEISWSEATGDFKDFEIIH